MSESRWWTYLQRLMGDDNAQQAAQRAGISSSNFSRWKKGANADPEFVVKLARAYHANVLEALVEAEFITPNEAAITKVPVGHSDAIRAASMEELIDELKRKIGLIHGSEPGQGSTSGDANVIFGAGRYSVSRTEPNDNVHELTSLGQAKRVADVDVQALIASDEPYAANTSKYPIPEDDHGWDA